MRGDQPIRQVVALRIPKLFEMMHIHAVAMTNPVEGNAGGSIHYLYHRACIAIAAGCILRRRGSRIVLRAFCGVASVTVLWFQNLPYTRVTEALQGVLDTPNVFRVVVKATIVLF